MYFPAIDPISGDLAALNLTPTKSRSGIDVFSPIDPISGDLAALNLTPTKVKNFKINRASQAEAQWLRDVLNREGRKLGTRVDLNPDNTLTLRWD